MKSPLRYPGGKSRAVKHILPHFPEDVKEIQDQDYIRGYERYYKVMVEKVRIYEQFTRKEDLLDEGAFQQYIQQPAWIIEGDEETYGTKKAWAYNSASDLFVETAIAWWMVI